MPSYCWKSRSYQIVWNNLAACWVVDNGHSRRGKFGGSLVHSMFFHVFARWQPHLWFKRWGIWGDRLSAGG